MAIFGIYSAVNDSKADNSVDSAQSITQNSENTKASETDSTTSEIRPKEQVDI